MQSSQTPGKFTPPQWVHSTNIYEVNLRQYTPEGSFAAFERELPRLRSMGVETLWFMPITPISSEKRLGSLGSYYACSSYLQTNPEFGTIDDFKQLVAAAHQLGFKVVMDWVANHTGWDHEWTVKHPEFYKHNAEGKFYDAHGWEDVIDLDYGNPQMRAAMIDCMRFWVEACDIDGFRCDMAMLVPLDFWQTAREQLDAVKNLFWLAECEEPGYHPVFDATYGWQWLHRTEALYRRQTGISGLEEVLQYYEKGFPAGAMHLLFTTNHDENSHSGSEYERLGDAALAFAVFSCTWDALPLVYSGQELPNKKRLKFFDKDQIDWDGKYRLQEFYRKLLNLKKNHPAAGTGDSSIQTLRLQTDADKFVFAFLRTRDERQLMVLLNLSPSDKPLVRVKDTALAGSFTNLFSGYQTDFTRDKYFAFRPWEYQVYVK